MGSCGKNLKVALVLVLVAAMILRADAAISCGSVAGKMLPCLPYLQGQIGSPSGGCCGGVRSLYQATSGNRADRVTTCNCIKQLASSYGGLVGSNVGNLAGECGVNLGYTPSLGTPCNSIP